MPRMELPSPSPLQAGREPLVAVLIPCYNEAVAIARVLGEFRSALPQSTIYVYDNNSTDDTARIAGECGAVV